MLASVVSLTVLATWLQGVAAQEMLKDFSYPAGIPNWWLAGQTIPVKDSLMVSTGVIERQGIAWNKEAVPTNDFEIKVEISITRPSSFTKVFGESFAMWYVYENGTDAFADLETKMNTEMLTSGSWLDQFDEAGFMLVGYRGRFDGLGVFFLEGEEGTPGTLAAFTNSGSKAIEFESHFKDAPKLDFANGKKFNLIIRVEPNGVSMKLEGGVTFPVNIIPGTLRKGGYLGFTSFSGISEKPNPGSRTNVVQIHSVAVHNYDKSYTGEATKEHKVFDKFDKSDEDQLRKTSSRKDFREESGAIDELTEEIFQFLMGSQFTRKQTVQAVETMKMRVATMERALASVKEEMDKKTGHHMMEEFDQIKADISSLSSMATHQHKARKEKLDLLHKDITHVASSSTNHLDEHLDKFAESHHRTQVSLDAENQKMFGVSIFAIAFVVVAGLSLYNKFRCWEKKHIL